MSESQSCMITVDGLSKRFGERLAVDGLSFSVAAGEIFGLLGPNGAGKTTTMSMMTGLLAPDAGRVELCGLELAAGDPETRRAIGYVPQDLALYPSLSARDNLLFFGRVYGLRGADLQTSVAAALDMVGLGKRAKERVDTFSGGMKRRLNIAAGLVHRPRVLFLDEPTVGVDPQSRNFILEHVERLRAEGMTVVYTTHYMEEANRLCDRLAIVDEGRILALDTKEGLLGLLGGGVLMVGLAGPPEDIETIRLIEHAVEVTWVDGQLKVETDDAHAALLELMGLCGAGTCAIQSLQILEPNLENVFLHLTGKRLRD